MVLNERQAGVVIEDVTRHNGVCAGGGLLRLAVDTHGYMDVGMAIAKLLDFDLCPWLCNLSERKLYLSCGLQVSDGLEGAVSLDIPPRAIREGWDGLLCLMVSIHSGRVSVIVVLQRFGSATQGDLIHWAVGQLGKLLRTLFLCDFFSDSKFRRELYTLLDRGESTHQLQWITYFSKVQRDRGWRRDETVTISGSLMLLTNPVIGWNMWRTQVIVDAWCGKRQRVDDDWLRRMGPVHFAYVNLRGVLSFLIHQYQDVLLEVVPRRRASQA